MPDGLREKLLDELALQGTRSMKTGLRAALGRRLVRIGGSNHRLVKVSRHGIFITQKP
jgi:hypothetical protein